MFRPEANEPGKKISSYEAMREYDIDRELSSYGDENDTTNVEALYHYETSEDPDEEASEQHQQDCCPEVNRQLLVYKLFYLIFFGAVGALFPYLAVFYKQLWLSPHQVGVLIGLRPFIQMCASPLWGVLADTYNVGKWILLMSIGAWLASNYSISLVKPERYDAGCSLNLTYLPLTSEVDEQDISWVRIEPVVSKKYNISRTGSVKSESTIKQEHTSNVQGQQGIFNEDYASDNDEDRGNDEDQFFRYDNNDELNFNFDENSLAQDSEKNQGVLLYTASEKSRNRTHGNSKNLKTYKHSNEVVRNKVTNKTNNQRYESKLKNKTVMEILEKMYKAKNMEEKRSEEEHFGFEREARQLNLETMKNSMLKGRNREQNSKSKINWILWYRNLLTKRKAVKKEIRKDKKFGAKKHKRNVKRHLREDERMDGETQEESDEYLEDVLNDSRKGEFYAESILPHQRVLAKEGLKEEFDSLRSTDGMFWPIVNKVDPSNSSDTGHSQHRPETTRIFNILLIITILGTILSSPAATLSDTATLQVLGDDKYRYGQQRLWGAIGWGLGAFIVGTIVSVTQEIEPCEDPKNIDYILSFYVYAVAMGLAFVCALFFKFAPVSDTSYRESFWEAVRLFVDCQHLCFILTLLCAGASMGFTHTFLFWHLHDIGGSQFLFSIVAAIQCISEVVMYFLSGYLILKIGCDSVLYIGLLANVMRLFTYSIITQPYFSVPLEILQGISSASIWTAAVCYVGLNDGVQVTLQAMLHGIYWGLGHGGGGILGGISVSSLGSNATFIIFGICCIINLAILLALKYWKKLFEMLSGYISVETIPSGTYILVENQRSTHKSSNT